MSKSSKAIEPQKIKRLTRNTKRVIRKMIVACTCWWIWTYEFANTDHYIKLALYFVSGFSKLFRRYMLSIYTMCHEEDWMVEEVKAYFRAACFEATPPVPVESLPGDFAGFREF